MYRDITIGNFLRLVDEVDRKPSPDAKRVVKFRVSTNGSQAAVYDANTWGSTYEPAPVDGTGRDRLGIVEIAEAPEHVLLDTLKILNKCRAVWTDADMAANLNIYFGRKRNDSKVPGTREFQSWAMRIANKRGEDYAHSPFDDLHSFFWTTLWATLNNKNQIQTRRVVDWQSDLRGTWQERGGVMDAYSYSHMDSSYSPMTVNMRSFLRAWKSKVYDLLKEGHAKSAKLSQSAETTGDDILDIYKHLMFRGVHEYFDLILEHKDSLGQSV